MTIGGRRKVKFGDAKEDVVSDENDEEDDDEEEEDDDDSEEENDASDDNDAGEEEEGDEHAEGDGHGLAVEGRGGDDEAFEGGEHGYRRGDDGVAVEQCGAKHP